VRGAGLVGLLAAVALLGGCRQSIDRTGGLSVDVRVTGEGNLAVRYVVATDGTIGFAGGHRAQVGGSLSWQGELSDEEISALQELLERDGWWARQPTGSAESPARRTRIKLGNDSSRLTYTVRGVDPTVERLVEALDRIARQRLDPILESLPKPTAK